MENNLENKAKFFAQYWGQEVLMWHDKAVVLNIIWQDLNNDLKDVHFLRLKPLSSITDEDAAKLCKIFDVEYDNKDDSESHFDLDGAIEWIKALYSEPAGYYVDGYTGNQLLSGSDYLRSKGYALPYMGLSVKQLVEYGWVKLT